MEGFFLAGLGGEVGDPAGEELALGGHALREALEHGECFALRRALFVEQAEAGIFRGDGGGAGLQLAEVRGAGGDFVARDVFPGDEAIEEELDRFEGPVPLLRVLGIE